MIRTVKDRENNRLDHWFNLKRKYQLLFLNGFKFTGLDYMVSDFLMDNLLKSGTIAAFSTVVSKHVPEAASLAFGVYIPYGRRDWKGDPLRVRIMNQWRNPLVPENLLYVGKNVVILDLGFIPQRFINEYVDRLVDIQATIDSNLLQAKRPFILKSTNKKDIDAIERIFNNAELLYTENDLIDVLDLKVDYIIDKLVLYKRDVEAELLSVLGIDNVKFEKKAQMTKDEVNANEDEIDAYRKVIRDRMEAFFAEIREVLSFNVSIEKDADEIYEGGEENDI